MPSFSRLVQDLQKCVGNLSADVVENAVVKMRRRLHPHHYLIVLAERHLVSLLSKNLPEKSIDELAKIKSLCKEVICAFQWMSKSS